MYVCSFIMMSSTYHHHKEKSPMSCLLGEDNLFQIRKFMYIKVAILLTLHLILPLCLSEKA